MKGKRPSLEDEFIDLLNEWEIALEGEEHDTELKSFSKLSKKGLPYFYDISHLSDCVGVSSGQVWFIIKNKGRAYRSFKIRKKTGSMREINAPSKQTKLIQRWILDNVLYMVDPGFYPHGFIPKKSIVTNAAPHVGKSLLLGIDIKDFFPSITQNRVRGLFKSLGYNQDIAWALSEICTFNYKLPQGAPTSPMIANLIARQLDRKIGKYCQKRGLTYTRYADDIAISGGRRLPLYVKDIFAIIEGEDFEVNIEKTRIHGKGSCQKVTGIVVNEKVTLERKKRRQLRAIMHNIEKKGHLSANIENDPFFKERIHGMLSFAKMVDPKFAKPLIVTYQMTDWTAFERQTQILKEDELIERSLKKSTNAIYIKFDEMGFFKDIERIPPSQPIEDVLTRLSSLREKCGEHSKENCRDCLAKQKNLYHGCMKFILGHYTGTTGGHHHGHEMFDISATTEVHGEEMDVAFLLKARDDTNTGNSLLAQFIDNFDSDENQVISIVSPVAINRGTNSRIKVIVREMDSDKYLCLILRQEMIRILYDFGKKYPKVYSFK